MCLVAFPSESKCPEIDEFCESGFLVLINGEAFTQASHLPTDSSYEAEFIKLVARRAFYG